MRRLLASVVAGLMLVTGCDRGSHPGNIDKPAPQFVMGDGTRTVDLSKLRGRVVVLNLWATWCAPCIEELPSLLALQKQMPDLAIVAVSMDTDPDVYQRFLVDHHVNLLTVRDEDQKVNALYGTVQIPETYIIDKQGVLRRKFIGAQVWTSPEITSFLARM
ncbi:TlpA disulfide reductase family protein [Granulicella sp. S190]|uniref:TlpA family protein disulfide reductase n=1 Tax=Granulicella sp. S190 TaxID=1747226 RepID=UPI0020B13116|nr:TlpA disulfide reductase family protein [Granulicella sp. S190]